MFVKVLLYIPDIMHDVLEGALAYEMKLMLRTFIQVDHYFELALLNEKIASSIVKRVISQHKSPKRH